jgi:nucleotide-binding universal stress UspA family protein
MRRAGIHHAASIAHAPPRMSTSYTGTALARLRRIRLPGGRMSDRVVFHVVPNASADAWLVTQEGGGRREEFRSKEEAVEAARKLAERAPLAQVKVHRKDGNMDYESTYGEDPRNIPG